MNLELIKNNIIFRLITKKEFDRLTKQSEATKDEFPYRKWNDLYLIYRSILPNQSEDLVTTMLISNFIMKRLKFTEEELFQFAKTNTAKRTGIIVKPLSNPFSDIFDFCNEMSAKTDIWNFSDDTSDSAILSNKNYMNGAALILCDEVIMNQRNSCPYENMSQEEKDQRNLQLMDQQIQQSRGIRKIFFLVLRKMQKDNIEADRRKHDRKCIFASDNRT